ncbi:hypothetical protein [Amycolatopsis sp. TNS106]|uniref:hypothetical protein n=1 Tax=Amycolatopsis sp. TNS106 TaxID=2861750 RepID=UPI001C58143E|nr:hypothetical protein [Amycolatopsis sp. TNS106]
MTETGRSPWLSDLAFYITDDPVTENVNRAKAAEAAMNDQVQQGAHGPGFRLDRDHATRMVEKAMQVKLALENDQRITQTLERMQSAAQDPVSMRFTKAATWNGGQPGAFAYGAGHVRLEMLYIEELIERLNTALGRTTQNDQEAGKAVDDGVKKGKF